MRKIKMMAAAVFRALALLAVLAACADGSSSAPPPPPGRPIAAMPWRSATLVVGTEPRQTFAGLGVSEAQFSPYRDLGAAERAEVDRLLFDQLDMRIFRLWYAPGRPEEVRDTYQASGVIDSALAGGVTELLLGPGNYIGDPDEHARAMAADVRAMREEWGIPITATGVVNEPDAEDWKIVPPEHYVPLAVAMRRELMAAGQGDVTILGLEFASADDAAIRWFDTVAADPAALAAFDALATHSYNMAATQALGERARRHGKQYWMTEAGGGIVDGSAEFDYDFAAGVGARYLNDLNNDVTHWVWFLGLGEGTRDVYQKLVMCDGRCAVTDRIYVNYGYHYIRQITDAFPVGTVLRHVTSDLPGFEDLEWTYGPKPPLNAAAGVRPDGRWVIGVVNDTPGIDAGPLTSWAAPANFEVTLQVPELAEVDRLEFDLCRTNPGMQVRCGSSAVVENGVIALPVTSLELLTLVARAPAG
jgi:hypothetical protein